MTASVPLARFLNSFINEVCARRERGRPTSPQKIVICGSIGAGKSRLLEHLSEQGLEFTPEPEPLDSWINYRGHDLLEMVYSGELPGRVTNMAAFIAYLDQEARLERMAASDPDEAQAVVIAERDLTQVFLFQILQ